MLLGGVLGFMTMQYDQALEACGEIVASDDPLLGASARYIEALTHWFRGAPEESVAAFAQAREHLAALSSDHPPVFTVLLIGLPVVHDFGAPRVLHEETLATFRDCGPRQAEGYIWLAEAQLARFEHDDDRARQLSEHAVERFRGLGDRRGTALATGAASCVARTAGDLPRARELLVESRELRRATGDTRLIGIGVGLESPARRGRRRARSPPPPLHRARGALHAAGRHPGAGRRAAEPRHFELAQGEFATARELLDRATVHMHNQHLPRAIVWVDLRARRGGGRAGRHRRRARAAGQRARVRAALGEPGGWTPAQPSKRGYSRR
jgi:hypothetical protein